MFTVYAKWVESDYPQWVWDFSTQALAEGEVGRLLEEGFVEAWWVKN